MASALGVGCTVTGEDPRTVYTTVQSPTIGGDLPEASSTGSVKRRLNPNVPTPTVNSGGAPSLAVTASSPVTAATVWDIPIASVPVPSYVTSGVAPVPGRPLWTSVIMVDEPSGESVAEGDPAASSCEPERSDVTAISLLNVITVVVELVVLADTIVGAAGAYIAGAIAAEASRAR